MSLSKWLIENIGIEERVMFHKDEYSERLLVRISDFNYSPVRYTEIAIQYKCVIDDSVIKAIERGRYLIKNLERP